MEEDRTKTKGFSVRKEREAELDAALRKMKMMRPFDSMSEIIIDAIVQTAARMDQQDAQASNGYRRVAVVNGDGR